MSQRSFIGEKNIFVLTVIATLSAFTKVIISVVTYSMVQSPSWAANWFAASQEIPRISRNP